MANLDFKSLEFLTSLTFNFKTVSDTVTSSSYSVSSPVASGDRVAADLDLIDGGCFRWRMVSLREGSRYSVKDGVNRDGYDTDEDDFDYYDDDLDDDYELVKVQRIRKSGKRTFAKNVTSSKKRASYSQLKSGCVHGKHGLCIKFRC